MQFNTSRLLCVFAKPGYSSDIVDLLDVVIKLLVLIQLIRKQSIVCFIFFIFIYSHCVPTVV